MSSDVKTRIEVMAGGVLWLAVIGVWLYLKCRYRRRRRAGTLRRHLRLVDLLDLSGPGGRPAITAAAVADDRKTGGVQ